MKSKYNFEKVEIEGETMMVPINGEGQEFHGVLRLNETAAAIMELLAEETTEEEIVDRLMNEYRYTGEKEKIAASVHRYIQKMIDAGVVE